MQYDHHEFPGVEDVFNSLHTLVAASCLEVVEFHPESSSRCSTAVQGPCAGTRFCLIAASAQDMLSPNMVLHCLYMQSTETLPITDLRRCFQYHLFVFDMQTLGVIVGGVY